MAWKGSRASHVQDFCYGSEFQITKIQLLLKTTKGVIIENCSIIDTNSPNNIIIKKKSQIFLLQPFLYALMQI